MAKRNGKKTFECDVYFANNKGKGKVKEETLKEDTVNEDTVNDTVEEKEE